MKKEQYINNLNAPKGKIDVILDTDAFNEIDDQFAISLMIRSVERFNVIAITAAPFFNEKASSVADGMEKSYREVKKLLGIAGRDDLNGRVFRGSERYLADEATPVESDAAEVIAETAKNYSPDKPLYIIGIGAITNIASALIKKPEIADNIVVLWLGGNAVYSSDNYEFNIRQDVAAARVVFDSECPMILFPCRGVTDVCRTTGADLRFWLEGKDALCDYLVGYACSLAEKEAKTKAWGRVIWDIVTIVWLLKSDAFESELIPAPVPEYDHKWSVPFDDRKTIRCITHIDADLVFDELYSGLTGEKI